MNDPADKRHPSWLAIVGAVAAIIAIIATVASPIYYSGQINATTLQGQSELRSALRDLNTQLHDLTIAVGNAATANAALTQQLRDMDHDFSRRLEVLEKDRTIESYKRN